jgi:acylphosphatase
VGFRYTTCRVAGGYDVTGWVRNVSDGSVECLVEGESAEIDAFLADLAGQMSYYIRGKTQQEAPYTGGHSSFGVRY